MLTSQPGPRDRRLLSTLLILAVVAVFFFIVEKLSLLFFYFGDILLTFFLAWLLAFIISPIVTRIVDAIPRLPRAAATVLVYSRGRAGPRPDRRRRRRRAGDLDRPVRRIDPGHQGQPADDPRRRGRQWLNSIGLNQIDLVAQAEAALGNLDTIAAALVAPLQQIAVASLGVVGTLLIVFFLSIYMVLDRDAVLAFLFRIVPPSYSEEARLLRDVGLALVRRLPARPGADGRRLLPGRARHEPAARAAAGRPDVGRRRPAPDDPVLRAVRVVGAAGHRRPRPPAGRPRARRSS